MQAKSTNSSKQRKLPDWIGCSALFLGVPLLALLLYSSYCWGIWGRSSLLLQYYFQCKCPAESEKERYPKEAEILFSACRSHSVVLSPSGRFLLVHEGSSGLLTYLLDLETMQKTSAEPVSSFLSDEIAFIEDGLVDKIIDFSTGRHYPIRTFRYVQQDAYSNGELKPEVLIETLQRADEIFLTNSYDTVIVLMSDFTANMDESFTFDISDIPGSDPGKVEQFLTVNNIKYEAILESYPGEVVSPDGKFIARDDGIYLTQTNQQIVEGAAWLLVRGWTSDGSSVIYTSDIFGPCLLRLALPMGDGSWCEKSVPQPVLRLKVPEQYLSSALP